MNFKDFYKKLSAEEKRELGKNANLSLQYLSHLANGHRNAGLKMIIRLEKATNGALTRAEIRPDIFGAL